MKAFNVTYREAQRGEEAMLSELTSATFRVAWLEEGNEENLESYVGENFSVDKLSEELADSSITYIIAEVNNIPAAYCKLERNVNPDNYKLDIPASIGRLYVKKEFQNLKLGSGLIDEALYISAREKFKVLWLGVWFKNFQAIRLYERFGFKRFGEYKFVMGNEVSDDYLMKRPV